MSAEGITFSELVEKKFKENKQKNIEDVLLNYMNDNYQKKIKRFVSKNFFPEMYYEELNLRLKNRDLLLAAYFSKDPLKQNIFENCVAEYLNLEKLPPTGKQAVRFNLRTGEKSTTRENSTKSADFLYRDFYITQKYTGGSGGSQDNQYQDVRMFLEVGSILFKTTAILDGEYWTKNREKLKKELPAAKIYTVEEFKEFMRRDL